MKPIVFLFSNGQDVVIVSPINPESHTEASWDVIRTLVSRACTDKIKEDSMLKIDDVLEMVRANSDWKCSAVRGTPIQAWTLVE